MTDHHFTFKSGLYKLHSRQGSSKPSSRYDEMLGEEEVAAPLLNSLPAFGKRFCVLFHGTRIRISSRLLYKIPKYLCSYRAEM